MEEKKERKLLTILVVLLGAAMFYFYGQGISLGAFTLMTKFVCSIAITGLGLLAFLITPELKYIGCIIKDSLVLALPYLVTMFFSMILWMLNNCSFSDITRGISDPLYQLIGIVTGAAYTVMFREKAVYVQFASMALANTVIILKNYILVHGPVAFVKDLFMLVVTFGEVDGNMVDIEVHDLTFAIGLYLLHFLLKRGKVKYRGIMLLTTGFFFCAGLKRIAVGALVVALLVVLVQRVLPENGKRLYLMAGGFAIVICSVFYIWAIKNGLYTVLAEKFKINTMGRIQMNDFIDSYYTFSPSFLGYGLGYVSELLLSGAASRIGIFLGIHNDLLRIYIETGFWGYLGWLVVLWLYKTWYFIKKRGIETAALVFGLGIYCFFTYLTDNTYYYFYTNLAAFTLGLSYVHDIALDNETE